MSVIKINTVQPQIEIANQGTSEKAISKPDINHAATEELNPGIPSAADKSVHNIRPIIKPIYIIKFRHLLKRIIPMAAGLLFIYVMWTLASHHTTHFPGPHATWRTAVEIFKQPFYLNTAADMGLGWHIIYSLKNVLLGFMFAAIAGIPLGFMIGKYQFMSRMIGLVIGVFKPVSPLAWLPIGLLVFKTINFAAIWVVFMSAIWPIMINTAIGVSKAPRSYINVGKMLNLSEWEIMSKILFPHALPSIMNGLRLAIGIAWLVIVATEMLKSDNGIGFWILNAWKQADYERILIGILIIGIIGFMLEFLLKLINKRAFHQ